jgi:hypothetical protein
MLSIPISVILTLLIIGYISGPGWVSILIGLSLIYAIGISIRFAEYLNNS